jgi:hypothetical protein
MMSETILSTIDKLLYRNGIAQYSFEGHQAAIYALARSIAAFAVCVDKLEEQSAKHEKFLPRYSITPSGNVVIDEEQPKAEKETSKIPCCLCGGKVIEFTVPSEIWNKVMRPNGKETDKEYICYECWDKKLTKFLLSHFAEEVKEQSKPQKPAAGELWWYQWHSGISVPYPWRSWDGKTCSAYKASGEFDCQFVQTIPPDENWNWIRCSMPEVIRKAENQLLNDQIEEAVRKHAEEHEEKKPVVATGSTAFIAENQSLKERIEELEEDYSKLETRACHLTRTIVKWRIISERRGKTIYQLQNVLKEREEARKVFDEMFHKQELELMGVHSEGNEPTAEDVFMGDYYEKSLKRIAELEKQLAELQIDGRIESDGLKKQLAASQRDAEAFRELMPALKIAIQYVLDNTQFKTPWDYWKDIKEKLEAVGKAIGEEIEETANVEGKKIEPTPVIKTTSTKIEEYDFVTDKCCDNTNPKQPDPSNDLPKSEPSWQEKVAVVAKVLFGNCNQMLNYNYVIYPDKFGSYLFDPLHSESGCWKIVEALVKEQWIKVELDENNVLITETEHRDYYHGHGSDLAEQLVDAAYQWAKGKDE